MSELLTFFSEHYIVAILVIVFTFEGLQSCIREWKRR